MIKKIATLIIMSLCIVGCSKPVTLLDFLYEDSGYLDLDGQKIVLIGETYADEALIDSQVKANTTLYDCVDARFDEINRKYNCEIEYQCFGTTANYEERFTALMFSGICPADIIYGHTDSKLQAFTEAGHLYPLTNLKDFLDYENSEKFGSPGILEAAMVDGVPYAVQPCYWPGFQNNFNFVLIYNPILTTQQGISDLHEYYENQNWTWDIFQNIIENFDNGGDEDYYATMSRTEAFATMALASNGVKGVDYIDGYLKSDISTPKAIRAVEWMQEIFLNNEEKIFIPDDWELDEFIDSSVMTAITTTPQITAGKVQYESSVKFGIMPFPCGPDGTYGEWAQYTAAIRGFAIPANNTDPEVSARIINDLCEPFDEFGGEEGLYDYFNENVFFDPIDTEIFFAVGENVRYTYWRSTPNISELFNNVGEDFKTSSAVELLTSFEPKLQEFIDRLLEANYENYLYEHLYGDSNK